MRYLRLGTKGDDVAILQKRLQTLTFDPGQADGIFGPKTDSAVRRLQARCSIRVDGIVGADTNRMIERLLANDQIPLPKPVPPAHEGEEGHASKEHPAKTRAQAAERYGEIKDGEWPEQKKWLTKVAVPEEVGKVWLVDGKSPLKSITCNKDMAEPLQRAIQNIVDRGLVSELYSYEGCFNIRNVKGSSNLSCHAYGLAIDLNYKGNELGDSTPAMPLELVACFKDEGFSWGGDFKSRKDGMHFSFAWE